MPCRVLAASPDSVTGAAETLAAGDLVILPTDTVYGLAADIANDAAVARIPVAKGRSADMPLQLLFGLELEMVARYAEVTPLAGRWLAAQGPGGWTLILPAKPGWTSPALAGGSTVAIRVPANAIVQGVVAALGRPVAATSANRHGEPSPVTCEQAVRSVGGSAVLALDDGPAPHGVDSTIIDLSVTPRLLRLGAVTREEVARTLGLPTIGGGQRGGRPMAEETGIGKKTVRDVDVAGKRVLLRVDLNVPLAQGEVAADTRIRASLPTIEYLCERGARVILCSHLGRPKGGADPALSLRPVAERLDQLLDAPVRFVEECIGPEVRSAAGALADGEVLLLENLRFHPEEEANDPAFAKELASLAGLYVNDAFGAAHRAHASTAGVAGYLPAVAGLLLEREVRHLKALVEDPPRPFAAIVGGAKVSTKTAAIEHLLPKIDLLLVGGGMANTFLAALGVEVGRSLVEPDQVAAAKAIMDRAGDLRIDVVLPIDVVIANGMQLGTDEVAATVDVAEVPPGKMILDIGPRTLELFRLKLRPAKAVIWNGPMGVFEVDQFSQGSFGLARLLAGMDATTVAGGGETAAVVARAGLEDSFTHVSTGGGASLEMLEGKELPGVAALDDA